MNASDDEGDVSPNTNNQNTIYTGETCMVIDNIDTKLK